MNIKREPALFFIALLAPAVQLAVGFLVKDPTMQALVNGAAALVAGALVAVLVRGERLVPVVLGLAQALLALGVQAGWAPSAEVQAVIAATIAMVAGAYTRTQVVAPPAVSRAVSTARRGAHDPHGLGYDSNDDPREGW